MTARPDLAEIERLCAKMKERPMTHVAERVESIVRRLRALAMSAAVDTFHVSMLSGDANYLDDLGRSYEALAPARTLVPALVARVRELEAAQAWRPIETAPTDAALTVRGTPSASDAWLIACREQDRKKAASPASDPLVKAIASAVYLHISWKDTRAEAERVVRAAMEEK